MSEYRKGEHVRVTIEGPVTQDALGSLYIDAGDGVLTEVPKSAPGITIERLAPAEWPPRPGDLWRDRDGDVWLTCKNISGLVMVCASGHASRTVEQTAKRFGPLTLVHREDEHDGDACKCGFRAPELGPHPDCPTHTQDGGGRG